MTLMKLTLNNENTKEKLTMDQEGYIKEWKYQIKDFIGDNDC